MFRGSCDQGHRLSLARSKGYMKVVCKDLLSSLEDGDSVRFSLILMIYKVIVG